MNARGFKGLRSINELFFYAIVPNIGGFHLDFGCGDGRGSILQAGLCPNSIVVGYDVNSNNIQIANEKLKSTNRVNVLFSDSLDKWNFGSFDCSFNDGSSVFDSASANFVFHENPDILRQIYPLLKEKGKLLILDYSMKGISKRDFYKRFCFGNERRIMNQEGFDECYKKHTRFSIDDCISFGESAGFKTINTALLEKYFLWIGQK